MGRWLLGLGLVLALFGSAEAATPGPLLQADEVMQLLKAGNARHIAGETIHDQQGAARREVLARNGQRPLATILGCSDSRAPLEIVFDQGVGNIFVTRVAGNLVGPLELGTIEYGVGHLGTPVVLVLGHTSCGAVQAAIQNAKAQGSLSEIIDQIRPAVAKAKEWSPTASGEELLNKSIKASVWLSMEKILRKSQMVREHVQDGRILLVGGVYDLVSGQVTWLGQHPDQSKILAAGTAAVHKPRPKAKVKAETSGEEQGSAKHSAETVGEVPAASEASPSPKPAAKPVVKPAVKAAAKQPVKASAKPSAEPAAAPEGNPNARSEGEGELLAPATDKAPVKAAKGKAAHP